MAEHELLERLARTNVIENDQPLPADWRRETSLDSELRGSDIMSTTQKTRPVEAQPTPPTNRWKLAIAAAVAIIVALTAFSLFSNQDNEAISEPAPTTLPADPDLARAEQIVDAFFAGEEAGLRGAIGTELSDETIVDQMLDSAVLNIELIGRQPCMHTTPSQILCDVTAMDDVSRAFSYELALEFSIVTAGDELIGVLSRLTAPAPSYVDDFFTWLRETHPSTLDVTCASSTESQPTSRERCWGAILERIPEYMASDEYTGPRDG